MAGKSMKPVKRMEALAFIALLVFLGWRIWPQVGAAVGIASDNAPLQPFEMRTLDGAPVTDSTLRGHVALINYWATWCGPCRVEMPGFQRIYEKYRARGFTVLGVSTDAGGPSVVRPYLVEHGITYPVAMAPGGPVGGFSAATVLPTSYLVDRNGRVRYEVQGIFAPVALEQAVRHLLDEPPPSREHLPR